MEVQGSTSVLHILLVYIKIYISISVRGECGVQRIVMYYKRIGCYVWRIRCHVCFMLELDLHSRTAMY